MIALVETTLALIPSDLKNHRITTLLCFVTDLQTHKQEFSIFVHKNQDFEASNSLILAMFVRKQEKPNILFLTMV